MSENCSNEENFGVYSNTKHLWKLSCPPYDDGREIDKADASTILHWLKQVISILVGLLCGFLNIQGWIGFVFILATLCSLTYLYVILSKIPDESLTLLEAMQEGLMPGIMTFTLIWTVCHTFIRGTL